MKAIILAGGYGTRLQPLTYHTPKPLLDLAGTPFIYKQIKWLSLYGIKDILVSVGYKSDEFNRYIDEIKSQLGVNIMLITEDEPLGTAGAVKNCLKYLNKDDTSILVINGDILCNVNLEQLINRSKYNNYNNVIVSYNVEDPSRYGSLKIKDNMIIRFAEKNKVPFSNWINAGIYLLDVETIDRLVPENKYYMFETSVFPVLAGMLNLYTFKHSGYWIDIGTFDKYYQAYKDIKNGKCAIFNNEFNFRYKIKFGTDGWRGLIGKDFTFDNARRVAYGICRYYLNKGIKGKVLIGYDTRVLGKEFAIEVARVVNHMGFDTYLCDEPTPTPAISLEVKNSKYAFGIIITASHNPYTYNGIKIRGSDGFSPSLEDLYNIENIINTNYSVVGLRSNIFKYKKVDIRSRYFNYLSNYIDFLKLKTNAPSVIYDSMNGVGWFKHFYPGSVFSINSSIQTPEPIENNLKLLKEKCEMLGYIGIANDCDCDRIGLVDEKGNFVNSHTIFGLILNHISIENPNRLVIKTETTTKLVDLICQKYNHKLEIVPVGFKNIASIMKEKEVLIGGEESGGFGLFNNERDGIFCALLILSIMSQRDMKLYELVDELYNQYGRFYYQREDFSGYILPNEFIYENELGWVRVRQSGTEPVVRIYAESMQKNCVETLINIGKNFLEETAYKTS